jgi:hypothetical protein
MSRELGEQRGVTAHRPRPAPQRGQHRLSSDPVEDERLGRHLEHARHGIPVPASVLHDERLAVGIAAGPEAPQDAAVTEVEHLRGAPGCDELHGRTIRR